MKIEAATSIPSRREQNLTEVESPIEKMKHDVADQQVYVDKIDSFRTDGGGT